MAAVQDLTDSELRKSLKDLGQNVGPITKSTRSIWEKKLLKLLESKSGDIKNETEEKKVRRRSTGRGITATSGASRKVPQPPSPPSTQRESSNRISSRKKSVSSNSKATRSKKLALFSSDDDQENSIQYDKMPMKSVQTSPIGFPSPEVSLKDIAGSNKSTTNDTSLNGTYDKSDNSYCRKTFLAKKSPDVLHQQKRVVSEFSDDDFTELTTTRFSQTKNYPAKFSPINGTKNLQRSNKASDFQEKSVYSSSSNPTTSLFTASTPSQKHTLSISRNKDSPNLALHKSSLNPEIRDEIDASLNRIRKSYSSKKPSPVYAKKMQHINQHNKIESPAEEEQDFDEEDEEEEIDVEFAPSFQMFQTFLRKNSKRVVLYFICGIFLTLLAIGLYFYTDEKDLFLGIAESKETKATQEQLNAAKCLYNHLSYRAGQVECGGSTPSKWMHISDLKSSYTKCFSKNVNLQDLILFIKKKFGKNFEFSGEDEICSNMASKPILCRIQIAFSVIFYRFLIVLSVICSGLFVYFIVKRRWIADDEETRQMLYYVDKIIDTLRRHHVVCITNKDIPPYLPIPHVRDMLIPLSSRKKMAKVWQKAVEFLNSSDSRVRVETQQIAGEDFEVWRWIGVCVPKSKKQKTKESSRSQHLSNEQSKSWQGPAFDEIDRVVRLPIVPPTPCLKIRYMHEGSDEKEENWDVKVRNAVLEKCNEDGGEIFHIFVDKSSKEGCVYVKCSSIESAGKSFRAMYGNWFDGRLVIVKFVTLARYHQRFPDALGLTTSLKPSSVLQSSLSWNEFSSALEYAK